MDIVTSQWDPIVIFLVVSKLDCESLRQWEINVSGISSDRLPTWDDLVIFLEARFRTLEMIDSRKQVSRSPQPSMRQVEKVKSFAAVHEDNSTVKYQCVMCDGDHFLYQCKSFSQLEIPQRREFVETKSLCFNCLTPYHSARNCRHSTSCRRCGKKHHSLLHQERDIQQGPTNITDSNITHISSQRPHQEDSQSSSLQREVNVVANFAKKEEVVRSSHVLLATAIVKVHSFNGKICLLRSLIDPGSQASFVTEEIVQTLGLKRVPVDGCVSGVGEGRLPIKHLVSFRIESRRDPTKSIQITAYVLPSIISRLPSHEVSSPDWLDIKNLSLADPGYNSPGKIDILLGAEVYSDLLLDDIIKHPKGHLLAQNTIFGWIISGRVSQVPSKDVGRIVNLHIHMKEDFSHMQFRKFKSNSIQKKLSKDEEKYDENYKSTIFRNKEERYVVRLSLDNEDAKRQYGGLKEIAHTRFHYLQYLQRKYQRKPKFKKAYRKSMQEYLDMNHIIKIKEQQNAKYFPNHNGVEKELETTKVREVVDTSCKNTNESSYRTKTSTRFKAQLD